MRGVAAGMSAALWITLGVAAQGQDAGQAPANAAPTPAAAAQTSPAMQPAATVAPTAAPAQAVAAQPKIYIVPAGTKVLLQLRNSLNTKSARAGDGVYLVSMFPVVVGSRVMIPTGVYARGVWWIAWSARGM